MGQAMKNENVRKFSLLSGVIPILSLGIVLCLWQFSVRIFHIPSYVLPTPIETFAMIKTDWDVLKIASWLTFKEFAFGFGIGSGLGFILAVSMSQSRWIQRILYPVLITSQAIPIVAIGAALVIWLGFGIAPKLFIVALIVFFPVVVNVLDGLSSVDKDGINLARAMGGSRLKIFRHIEMPATYTPLFSALKLSATFAVTGAVIGEQTASNTGGLGVYLTQQQSHLNTPGVFGAIILLAALGLLAFLFIALIEILTTPWRRRSVAPSRRRHR